MISSESIVDSCQGSSSNQSMYVLETVYSGEEGEIQVAVITFGGENATLHLTPQPASQIEWENLHADGPTPMGSALEMVRGLLEDKEQIPGRAYTPTLVLISDGVPTDSWETPLDELLMSGRAKKAMRLAMAIGEEADSDMLARFVANSEIPVFNASQASEISKFFRWVTMSVTSRTRSVNPNQIVQPDFNDDLDALG